MLHINISWMIHVELFSLLGLPCSRDVTEMVGCRKCAQIGAQLLAVPEHRDIRYAGMHPTALVERCCATNNFQISNLKRFIPY